MEQLTLNAVTRTVSGKKAAKKLREQGRLPAVMYDAKGEAFMLDVDEAEFSKVWKSATPTTLVSLVIDGKEGKPVLIKTTEYNIITDKNLHADFYAVDTAKTLHMTMNIRLTGNPVGVREGGVFEKGIQKLEIKCLPKDLPPRISVDISTLALNGRLTVKDIALPAGVTVLTGSDEVIALVRPMR